MGLHALWNLSASFGLAFFAQTGLNAGVVPFFQPKRHGSNHEGAKDAKIAKCRVELCVLCVLRVFA